MTTLADRFAHELQKIWAKYEPQRKLEADHDRLLATAPYSIRMDKTPMWQDRMDAELLAVVKRYLEP